MEENPFKKYKEARKDREREKDKEMSSKKDYIRKWVFKGIIDRKDVVFSDGYVHSLKKSAYSKLDKKLEY